MFTSPYGDHALVVDTLHYDSEFITGLSNLAVAPTGNTLFQNKVGHFRDVDASFLIKFTNFASMNALPDSVEASINSADLKLYIAESWGNEGDMTINMDLVRNDTSSYWQNSDNPDSVEASLSGQTAFYKSHTFSLNSDSLTIPLDVESLVSDWYRTPVTDSLYVNNGFVVSDADDSGNLMTAFYSADYSSNQPRLQLECSLYDTSGAYIQDSTFYVYGGGDLQFAHIPDMTDPGNSFSLSQGNIIRSYVTMDDIRVDTTVFRADHIINEAVQTLVIDDSQSFVDPEDTLYIAARMFRTNSWENDSISFKYTVYSDTFDFTDDTVRIDISELLQYMTANEQEYTHEGIFYSLYNEYNDFNHITIDTALSSIDIIYTRMQDDND